MIKKLVFAQCEELYIERALSPSSVSNNYKWNKKFYMNMNKLPTNIKKNVTRSVPEVATKLNQPLFLQCFKIKLDNKKWNKKIEYHFSRFTWI